VKRLTCDVLVVGSGPAGLAAAYGARRSGASRVLVLERNSELGGILPQCIHNGFGTRVFESDLTGPEYAGRWIRQTQEAGVERGDGLNRPGLGVQGGQRRRGPGVPAANVERFGVRIRAVPDEPHSEKLETLARIQILV